MNVHGALLLWGHGNSLAQTDLQPLALCGLRVQQQRKGPFAASPKGWTACWRLGVRRGRIQLAFGGLEWQLTAAFCLCCKCCIRRRGQRPPLPNNNPTSHSAQHKALRTAVRHTALVRMCACVHVRLCGGKIARENRRAPQGVRMQQPLSGCDFDQRRFNPTSFCR